MPRGGRSPLTEAQREARRDRGMEMALDGHSWPVIAEACGYGSRQAAQKDISRALTKFHDDNREQRQAQIDAIVARMDYSLRTMRQVLDADHPLVSDGRIVRDGKDGPALQDDGPRRAAVAEIRALDQQRAKLLGLDEATKVDTTQTVTY